MQEHSSPISVRDILASLRPVYGLQLVAQLLKKYDVKQANLSTQNMQCLRGPTVAVLLYNSVCVQYCMQKRIRLAGNHARNFHCFSSYSKFIHDYCVLLVQGHQMARVVTTIRLGLHGNGKTVEICVSSFIIPLCSEAIVFVLFTKIYFGFFCQ